ncbi:hypothetical protein Bca4012_037491 [Brassica carinata]
MASSSSSSALYRISNLQNHISPLEANNKHLKSLVKVSPEVSEAISNGRAVVALESTIISHGMPYPQNLQTAKEVESIVRENGAVPATIAILNGVPCIGLNEEELERLASLGKSVQKTAGRDIAYVVATRGNGATTVSATLFFASMVGIQVFVTGGIGGVHRHANHSMDISSDLTALGRTPIAVISAGVKSILDIPKTLEYLETQQVYVAAYKSDEFPAFFTEKSGCKAPSRVDSPEDCARVIGKYANMKLNRQAGILFAVPIPKQHSAAGNLIESATQRALTEAREQNVTGNAETPFLLARVNELTGGTSLAASILSLEFLDTVSDIALVKNNALIGSQIAVALSQLMLLAAILSRSPALFIICFPSTVKLDDCKKLKRIKSISDLYGDISVLSLSYLSISRITETMHCIKCNEFRLLSLSCWTDDSIIAFVFSPTINLILFRTSSVSLELRSNSEMQGSK